MEFLSKILAKKSLQQKPVVGIKLKNHGTTIHFLKFADDKIILANATTNNLQEIINILQNSKSSLQCSENLSRDKAKQLADFAGIQVTTNLEKYMGIPILKGMVCNSVFDDNINNEKQLSKWKANALLQAGRALLINANLNAQTNYLM